jgi:hypothetical protein
MNFFFNLISISIILISAYQLYEDITAYQDIKYSNMIEIYKKRCNLDVDMIISHEMEENYMKNLTPAESVFVMTELNKIREKYRKQCYL